MFAPHRPQASTYRNIQLESSVREASPHRLISLLFEGAVAAIRQGTVAMQAGDHAGQGQALTRAIRILDEGLKASLDPAAGELALRLSALYDHAARQLLIASARNDATVLGEVLDLILPLQQSWLAIAPEQRADGTTLAAGAL